MEQYEKTGYLNQDYRIFHLCSEEIKEYEYHYHDFYKIVLMLSGEVTYCIEGKSYQLNPYDFVLVNRGEVHKPVIQSTKPYERIIIYISYQFLQQYHTDAYQLGYCFEKSTQEKSHVLHLSSSKQNKLYHLCKDIEASLSDEDYAASLYQNILFLEFMIHLNRAVIHDHITFSNAAVGNEKILSVLEYLNNHLTEEISIDDLAKHFYTSRFYLMHSFKQETGYTIGQYLTTKRLLYAHELIKNDMPVTQACHACGFQNYSSFSRAYKKSFGVSPTIQKQQDSPAMSLYSIARNSSSETEIE